MRVSALFVAAAMVSAMAQDSTTQLAKSQNAFGMKLLSKEAASHPHQNVFLSPLSIYLALAMAENGAAADTRTAMRHTLEVPPQLTEDEIGKSVQALSKDLRSQTGMEISIANALWSDPSLPLSPAFVERCRNFFDATATSLDFSNSVPAAEEINAWVKKNTGGKIDSIVTPGIVAASKAILTNAIYFKAAWEHKFPKSGTSDAPFHLTDGKQKTVPMMRNASLEYAYRSGDGFEGAELSYRGSQVAMFAILPARGTSPEQALGKVSIDSLIHSNNSSELDLRLPRFTLDYSASLKDPLTSMGMGIAFRHPGADFIPLGSPLFFIGDVLHKTRLEVDEEGTVAAAATATVMVGAAMRRPQEKKVLVFDRPFGVLLCDTTTGTILFAGVIYDP